MCLKNQWVFKVLFFLLLNVHINALEILDIVSEYNLKTGKYLLPAADKICISNWLYPTLEDYRVIQSYLSSDRPELSYLNYPGTDLREQKMRNFKIRDRGGIFFDIFYLNGAPNNKKNCIVTYISCDDEYIKNLTTLFKALKTVGFDGHFICRIGGWPATEEGSLELFDVPYSFKIFALLEAKRLGYKNCLWLDACMIPQKSLDPIFECIENNGIFFYSVPGYSYENNIEDFAVKALGSTLEKFLQMKPITTIAVGLDLTNERSLNLLNEWHQMAKEKLGFLSFIPEMAPFCILVHKFNLVSFARPLPHPYRGVLDPDGIMIWNHK